MLSDASPSTQTVRDLLHSLRNCFSLISGHAQYLLGQPGVQGLCEEELRIIRRAAEQAANDLDLVPDCAIGIPLLTRTRGGDAAEPPASDGGTRP